MHRCSLCTQSVVSPSAFLRRLSRHDGRWGEGSQQDANEFLHSLLESLQARKWN